MVGPMDPQMDGCLFGLAVDWMDGWLKHIWVIVGMVGRLDWMLGRHDWMVGRPDRMVGVLDWNDGWLFWMDGRVD